jgi:hypothetical protein
LSISNLIGIPQFIAPLPISNKPFDIQIYLVRLQAMFAASTYSIVGDGQTTKFWDDRWLNGQSILEIAPQLHTPAFRSVAAKQGRLLMGSTRTHGRATFTATWALMS